MGVGALKMESRYLIRLQHCPTTSQYSGKDMLETHSGGDIWIE